jgi:hypothetical protein
VERSLNPGTPEIRFLSDYLPLDTDEDGNIDYWAQRIAFVRSTEHEAADPIFREAGSTPGPTEYVDGKNDREAAEAGKLRAPGGYMEVLYMAIPDDPLDPGVLTLYRAERAPPGGPGSLLDPDTIKKPEDMREIGLPLLTGVLHLNVLFWSSRTTSWDSEFGRPRMDGPTLCWDSTRGILPAGLRVNEFPFFRSKDSLKDPRDDISPRRVKVTFVYQRTARRVEEEAQLTSAISESDKRVPVTGTEFANTSVEPFIKVGTEWMQWSNRTSTDFTILSRGVRGTAAVPHDPAGRKKIVETARCGYTVDRVIEIPSHRETRNFR